MGLPSKEQIKEKYGISEDDFQILESIPSPEEMTKNDSFLMRLADCLGLKSWMWKTFGGVILAIIFIPPKVESTTKYWSPKFEKSYALMSDYWQSFSPNPPPDSLDYVAFVPPDTEPKYRKQPLPIDQYPQGTGVFPLSSHWTGPTGQWLG